MQAALEKVSKDLADNGQLVLAGWYGFRIMVIPEAAPQVQVDEMKMAFMGGALHLFTSIMHMLDQDGTDDPSVDDLRRMDLISEELRKFGEDFALKHTPTQGNG